MNFLLLFNFQAHSRPSHDHGVGFIEFSNGQAFSRPCHIFCLSRSAATPKQIAFGVEGKMLSTDPVENFPPGCAETRPAASFLHNFVNIHFFDLEDA